MIRKLRDGLGIPADALLQQPGETLSPQTFDVAAFPIADMYRRGYFGDRVSSLRDARAREEELLAALFAPLGGQPPAQIYCRHGAAEVNTSALAAWQARAMQLVESQEVAPFAPDALDERFFAKVARASYHAEGPRLVPSLLARHGIRFVVLGHLPKTYLDGACFMTQDGLPVVGMTLRFDRLDNFWFTLIHELSHVKLHLRSDGPGFFDDIEQGVCPEDDPVEQAADEFTRRTLIPGTVWQEEGPRLRVSLSEAEVIALAEEIEISPAIIAGRVRWETKNYSALTALVGSGKVRRLLGDLFRP
jgi:HTH-type transcriptional regulator/antitoxin HigA